ncbi:hypothetical protein U9M48_018902 [Paspalum notatum var. saurae]|uniref:Uncharacterized protein n=1 Tax=Paspalum notatum var. saurae TaxID=547442 RepID=A0AAQ3WQZ4_PASNO
MPPPRIPGAPPCRIRPPAPPPPWARASSLPPPLCPVEAGSTARGEAPAAPPVLPLAGGARPPEGERAAVKRPRGGAPSHRRRLPARRVSDRPVPPPLVCWRPVACTVRAPDWHPAPVNAAVYLTVHDSLPTHASVNACSAALDSHPPSYAPHPPLATPKLATSTRVTARPPPHDSVTSSPISAAATQAVPTPTVRNAARVGSPPASSKSTSVLGSPARRKERGTW